MHKVQTCRILVDCHVFDSGFQGTTTYLKGLYKELIKDRDKEFFMAASDTGNLEKIFGNHPNVTYLRYKSHNKFFRLLFEIPKLVRQNNIDYTHFQYIVSPFKKCRYIVTTHDLLFIDFPQYFPVLNRLKNTFLYRYSSNLADILFTVSEYSKERISEHFQKRDVYITCNAVESELFAEYDKLLVQSMVEKKYAISNYIIYVSRWEPRKNHELVLKTFVEDKMYENFQLLFIGDVTFENSVYNDYYQDLDSNIKNKIVQLSNVPFDDLLLLIRAARVSVYPSKAEGFGIPPLESLAAGVPTIASNATAMSDFTFMQDYLFDPYDQRGFSEKLRKALVAQPKEIEYLRDQLRLKYSWENAANVFRMAIEEHKKRA
jgi:glycosyltransferase involved in cell wall biosynthesis